MEQYARGISKYQSKDVYQAMVQPLACLFIDIDLSLEYFSNVSKLAQRQWELFLAEYIQYNHLVN